MTEQAGPVLVVAGLAGLVALGPVRVLGSVYSIANAVEAAATVGPTAAAPLVVAEQALTVGSLAAVAGGTATVLTTPAKPIVLTVQSIKG